MSEHERDLKAIEELHGRDMQAAKNGDFTALRALIDDEAVLMPPGGAVQRGAGDLDKAFAKMQAAPKSHEVLEYTLDFEEVRILGDYAFEWGAIRGSMRELASGEVTHSEYHVMRILKRQPDGAWKVYRSIWAPSG